MAKYDVGELITALNEAVNKLNNLRAKCDDLEKERDALRVAMQTARRDALEEAARLVNQTAAVLSNPSAKDALNYAAAAIRALGEKE